MDATHKVKAFLVSSFSKLRLVKTRVQTCKLVAFP